ncbi:MAG: hypothetical protein QOJ02_3338 [Acidobacteriota bacterium]|jgi:hypothetical protein|nr:hypothetical protein [Acidobacteriota bacterium]
MKTKSPLLLALFLLLAAVACGTKDANNANSNSATENTAKPAASANTTSDASPKSTLKPGEIPFNGFPTVGTTAKASEVVLCPSYNWIQDAATKGPDQVSFIFYSQKMSAPGDVESEVEFLSPGKAKVSNAYIIPIPAGQTAKVGDIVLTWWQSGSGMNRAIVVEAADPSEPTVRYLDIDYDNPAKSHDGKTTIGQMDEKLKPNSFVKISNTWEPGTVIAVNDGASKKRAQVIRVAGDKVLALGFVGKMQVYDKSACTPVPVVPKVKAGDKVKAPKYGTTFDDATVTKVDGKIGRVFVKFGTDTEEKAIPFGDVMTN